mmetsp:Transcript_11514/g.21838  ORF Transcript_11514/g.21838 Transcript_11514/m.21838 type:complete len:203 (-) Transcript_11514:125-733(-)
MRKRSPSTRLVGVLTKAAVGSTVRRADHGRAAPVERRVKLEEANRSGGQHMRKVAFWVSGHVFKEEKASRRLLVLSKANASARVDSSKTAARGSVRVVFTDCPGSKLLGPNVATVELLVATDVSTTVSVTTLLCSTCTTTVSLAVALVVALSVWRSTVWLTRNVSVRFTSEAVLTMSKVSKSRELEYEGTVVYWRSKAFWPT